MVTRKPGLLVFAANCCRRVKGTFSFASLLVAVRKFIATNTTCKAIVDKNFF